MIEKYYIPTSTLNFANILSTESISPKAFYEKRKFGIKRWHTVTLNSADNYISLYGKLPRFECAPSELEDHPMVIELSLNEEQSQRHLMGVSDDLFVCDHTLYFHPENVKFIFFSEQHKRIALSLVEQLLETKTLRLYGRRLVVQMYSNDICASSESVNVELNNQEIETDSKVNKLKGLLYGYYIGALLSCPKESVLELTTLRRIQAVISAICSNERRIPTPRQENELSRLLSELSPIEKEFNKLALGDQDATKVRDFIKKFFQERREYSVPSVPQILSELVDSGINKTEPASLKKITCKIVEKEEKLGEYAQLSPDKSEIIVVDRSLSNIEIQDEQEKKLFLYWANGLLLEKYYEGGCSVFQSELAKDVTLAAKDCIGAGWETSSIRNLLNGIRRVIAGETFDIAYDNGVISSIAAVILRSDSWEQMLRFMQDKGMYDYRLAFALYGELIGFANLYSTFTDNLLQKDNKYVWSVYKEFHGQLFDERIHSRSEKNDSRAVGEEIPTVPIIMQTEIQLPESVQKLFTTSEFLEMSKKYSQAGKYYYNIVAGLMRESTSEQELWEKIKNTKEYLRGTKQAWSSLVKMYSPFCRKKNGQVLQEEIQFEYPTPTEPFWKDRNAWSYICDLIPKNFQQKIKEDLVWFQNQYREGEKNQFYAKASRKNQFVIDAFCRLKEKKHIAYFPDDLRDAIKKRLYSLYDLSK